MSDFAPPQTLTEIEVASLGERLNFADGHASHALNFALHDVVDKFPSLWHEAAACPAPQAEQLYRDTFAKVAEIPGLLGLKEFRICPTASNSIDLTAAWLSSRALTTGLLTPCFDNIALLLRRRGIQPIPVPEPVAFDPNSLEWVIHAHSLSALFLVIPNNPTGISPSEGAFKGIVEVCRRNRVVLVLDQTFRFFVPRVYDEYTIVRNAGIDFIVVEDTGKTWPTQEMKASLLVTSSGIFPEIREIYAEVYLCVSNFSLFVLRSLLENTQRSGPESIIFQEVAWRRRLLRAALETTPLKVAKEARESLLGVEWIDCTDVRSGNAIADVPEVLARQAIRVLPGHLFYWDGSGGRDRIRWALMKPEGSFVDGVRRLPMAFAI
jgi:aspartate/methionine/tyrosine aminotransferase